ncbi:hypothetical protein VTN00DRAFT_1039 [Thermoascus crustaceus]|uniref:uncharacterized protein n=1 Tax=Thermoascus crustaceus TaxID=5088 RepID=UPI0037425383
MLAIRLAEVATMLLVQYIASDKDLGTAFAVVSSRTIFGSIFTAAFITVYSNKVPGKLQSNVVPAVTAAGSPESSIPALMTAISAGTATALKAVPRMTPQIISVTNNAVADSYAAAYAYVYYFSLALGCLAIIAAACARDFDCYLTDHVSRQIHRKETAVDPLHVNDTDSEDRRHLREETNP